MLQGIQSAGLSCRQGLLVLHEAWKGASDGALHVEHAAALWKQRTRGAGITAREGGCKKSQKRTPLEGTPRCRSPCK